MEKVIHFVGWKNEYGNYKEVKIYDNDAKIYAQEHNILGNALTAYVINKYGQYAWDNMIYLQRIELVDDKNGYYKLHSTDCNKIYPDIYGKILLVNENKQIINTIDNEVLIDRLAELFPVDNYQWNNNETVKIADISNAIQNGEQEEIESFDTCSLIDKRSTDWHIRRILYFINHPEKIKDIQVENVYTWDYSDSKHKITNGNHRFMAALWLNKQGKMKKVHCLYFGREDILDYLKGESDEFPVH